MYHRRRSTRTVPQKSIKIPDPRLGIANAMFVGYRLL